MFEKIKNMKRYVKMGGGFGLMGRVLVDVVLITITRDGKLTSINDKVVNLRVPTASASQTMLTGIHHSLAALRRWMILGNDGFKSERATSWDAEIEPAQM